MKKIFLIIKYLIFFAILLFIAFLIGYNVSTKVNLNYIFGTVENVSFVLIILISFFLGIVATVLFWGFISFSSYINYKKQLKKAILLKKQTILSEKKSNE